MRIRETGHITPENLEKARAHLGVRDVRDVFVRLGVHYHIKKGRARGDFDRYEAARTGMTLGDYRSNQQKPPPIYLSEGLAKLLVEIGARPTTSGRFAGRAQGKTLETSVAA